MLYVLTGFVNYEGETFLGIYSSMEKLIEAKEVVEKVQRCPSFDSFYARETQLDGEVNEVNYWDAQEL